MSLEDRVSEYLAAHPGASANEVWKNVGGNRPRVLQIVRELVPEVVPEQVVPAKSSTAEEGGTAAMDKRLALGEPRPLEELLRLDPYEELNAAEEQLIRDHYGYAPSERSTRAQRETIAERITSTPEARRERAWAQSVWAKQARKRRHLTATDFKRIPKGV